MEAFSKITTERVPCFYLYKIMSKYGLPRAILSDNGTQFTRAMVTDFWNYLGVQTKFVSVVHPRDNEQTKSANKVIYKRLEKKLDDAKGLCVKILYELLW